MTSLLYAFASLYSLVLLVGIVFSFRSRLSLRSKLVYVSGFSLAGLAIYQLWSHHLI
jgi:hypothetical protein